MSIRRRARAETKISIVTSCLLLITFTSWLVSSLDGAFGLARLEAAKRGLAQSHEIIRHKAKNIPGLSLAKTLISLSFLYSFSLLRFDFKQNLRTWPVISNGTTRSPPSFTVL
jgi:hypothetical protein